MADVAVLGLRVDASGAIVATAALAKELNTLGNKAEEAEAKLDGTLKQIFTFAAAATAIKKFADESIAAQNAQAQLEAAVAGAGAAAGRSVAQLQAMAGQLQEVSTFSDEAVQGAQAILLTFNQIRGDSFDRATKSVVELATRLGGDLQGAAISVGKALQNPEEGIAALTRKGIVFSDAQKQLITQLQKTGDLAGAQAVVLKQLETTYGGSAIAARQTLGGALTFLNNKFGELFEVTNGQSSGLVKFLNDAGTALGTIKNNSDAFAQLIGSLTAIVGLYLLYAERAKLAAFWTGVLATVETVQAFISLAKGIRSAADAMALLSLVGKGAVGAVAAIAAIGVGFVAYRKLAAEFAKDNAAAAAALDEVAKSATGVGAVADSGGGIATLSDAYKTASKELVNLLEKQRAINAVFAEGEDAIAEVNAQFDLKAKLAKIDAEFTGAQAAALRALAVELAASEKKTRELQRAERDRQKSLELDKEIAENAKRNAKIQADAEKEVRDALKAKAEERERGARTAARDLELLDREISLVGKSAAEQKKLTDAYLEQDKQLEFIAAGLDAVSAAFAAQQYVKRKNELDALTQSTTDWAQVLQDVNGTLRNLGEGLGGAAQDAVRYISTITNAIELLVRAQKQAKATQASGAKGSAGQNAVGALGIAGAGFGAGTAFGSTTSNKTVGALGGAASGAAAGALAGSVLPGIGTLVGGVIGGITGAIGGLLSASKNATQELIAQRAAQKNLNESLQALRATFGNDALGAAIAQAKIQFENLRKETEAAFSGKKNEGERNKILAELNALEARRIQLLKDEFAAQQQSIQTAARVRELTAQGRTAEAQALQQRAANEKEIQDLIKAGATEQSIAAVQAAQLAEAEKRLREEREQQQRAIFDLENGARAFTDPRGASDAAFFEEQSRRVFDALQRGASEAELAALRFFNAAEAANREAEKLEADTRKRESLLGRGLAASGDRRAAEDFTQRASQRQELVDAIKEGQSPQNIALLKFIQFAERSQTQMLRAIEDGTKAIQQRAKDEIAANNLLIETIRSDSAKQLAKLDEQIAETQAAARVAARRFDEQIAAVREQTKAQLDAIDAQIESARGALDAANKQVSALEKSTQTNAAVVEALQQFSNASKLGELSTLSPEQKLQEARAQFEALAAAAQGGDAKAAQGLPAAANALLQASRGFNASNSGFVSDFNRVQEVVAAVTQQFGKTLPIDQQALEAAKKQVDSLQQTVELLSKQKEAVQEQADKSIAILTQAKERAAEDAQRVLDALNEQKDKISTDAQAQIDKLTALNESIEQGVQKQIDALKAVEEEAHQQRLAQDSYWTTYLQLLAENGGTAPTGTFKDGVTPVVITAENNPVAAAQLEEAKRANTILEERLTAMEERMTTAIEVAVAASNDEVSVGNRIVQALAAVAAETRAAAQAATARTPTTRR